MKAIDQILKDEKFWNVQIDRTKVCPFPGKYPTRWKIQFWYADKLIWQYLGKPNPLLLSKIEKLRKARGQIVFAEFDKGGAFRAGLLNTPVHVLNIRNYSPNVCYFYYPWSVANAEFFDPWRHAVFCKKGIFIKRRFYFYSPYEVLMGESYVTKLLEHRTWLRKSNSWK